MLELSGDFMNTPFLHEYENEAAMKLHARTIERLSLDLGIPEEEVRRVYEIVLRRLEKGAKVRDYLPILVSRRARYLIKIRENSRHN